MWKYVTLTTSSLTLHVCHEVKVVNVAQLLLRHLMVQHSVVTNYNIRKLVIFYFINCFKSCSFQYIINIVYSVDISLYFQKCFGVIVLKRETSGWQFIHRVTTNPSRCWNMTIQEWSLIAHHSNSMLMYLPRYW